MRFSCGGVIVRFHWAMPFQMFVEMNRNLYRFFALSAGLALRTIEEPIAISHWPSCCAAFGDRLTSAPRWSGAGRSVHPFLPVDWRQLSGLRPFLSSSRSSTSLARALLDRLLIGVGTAPRSAREASRAASPSPAPRSTCRK